MFLIIKALLEYDQVIDEDFVDMVQQNVHPIFVSMSTRVDPLVADDMARKVLTINIVSSFKKSN